MRTVLYISTIFSFFLLGCERKIVEQAFSESGVVLKKIQPDALYFESLELRKSYPQGGKIDVNSLEIEKYPNLIQLNPDVVFLVDNVLNLIFVTKMSGFAMIYVSEEEGINSTITDLHEEKGDILLSKIKLSDNVCAVTIKHL